TSAHGAGRWLRSSAWPAPPCRSRRKAGRQASALASVENDIVREVASALGNTPTVCRKAYIDPVVFAGWREGRVQRAAATCRGERQWEAAAFRFLRRAHGGR